MTLYEFVDNIQILRSIYPMSCTSWFRSIKRNKEVGGLDNSFHRMGLAIDVVMDKDFNFVVTQFITDCSRLGLQAIDEKDHYHLEPK